jgi:hypothetical protein
MVAEERTEMGNRIAYCSSLLIAPRALLVLPDLFV